MKITSQLVIGAGCGLLLSLAGCASPGDTSGTVLRSPKDSDTSQAMARPAATSNPWRIRTSWDPWQLKEEMILQRNYAAAEQLARQLERAKVRKEDPLLVATIADVTYLEGSSAFGRITSEQIASRLAQLGFNVTEVKVRGSLYVRKGSGEYILSRDVEEIASQHEAVAVVSGTYAVGSMENMVSVRAVELATRRILAGYDYAVPYVPRLFPDPRILY